MATKKIDPGIHLICPRCFNPVPYISLRLEELVFVCHAGDEGDPEAEGGKGGCCGIPTPLEDIRALIDDLPNWKRVLDWIDAAPKIPAD